jgi:hypothetical protein
MQNPTNCTSAKSYSKGNRTHNFIQSTSPIPRYTWKKNNHMKSTLYSPTSWRDIPQLKRTRDGIS